MFDLEQFVADCRAALGDDESHGAIREIVARAVSEPSPVLRALGEPRRAQLQKLHQSGDLTILNVVWAPGMTLLPHDHRMWAVIGIYTGREDNIFWRRLPGSPGGKVEAVSARALCEGDTAPLGHQIIHSVTNPIHASPARSTSTAATSSASPAASGIQKRCWSNRPTASASCAGWRRRTPCTSSADARPGRHGRARRTRRALEVFFVPFAARSSMLAASATASWSACHLHLAQLY